MRAVELDRPEDKLADIRQRDRRCWIRVRHRLALRFITEDRREGAGRTLNVSSSGVFFRSTIPLRKDERVVCYIEGLGRLSGRVVRFEDNRAAVHFEISATKRDRMADQLTWLINAEKLNLHEERRADRYVPSETEGKLEVVGTRGQAILCTVTDISLVGVAVRTSDPRPEIGERVKVGKKYGVVARYVDGGFAIDFRA